MRRLLPALVLLACSTAVPKSWPHAVHYCQVKKVSGQTMYCSGAGGCYAQVEACETLPGAHH